jgi:CheY-like chemotaxis protein
VPGARDPTSSETNLPVKTILIVEDDTVVAAFLAAAIEQETPYQALLAMSSSQALEVVHERKPSLFLLDYRLPGISGLELYDQFHALGELEDVPALLISASFPFEEANKRNILLLQKPFELDELLRNIERLLT